MKEEKVARPDVLSYEQGRQDERAKPLVLKRIYSKEDLNKALNELLYNKEFVDGCRYAEILEDYIKQAKVAERKKVLDEIQAGAVSVAGLIEKARQEIAEDIGGLLCCLAGNLMMEDKEAGTLLAQQLQPLIDTIKARYLPHLPRKSLKEEK